MTQRAQGRKLAILAADGFEEVELTSPREAIENAGGEASIVSITHGTIQANKHREHGATFKVDLTLDDARAEDFDALLIPGGLFSPDTLRTNQKALDFASDFFRQKKPVFSICHGPQVLISANLVNGREMTGFEAIQQDLKNAGARVLDQSVVVDAGLVTSRSPDDLGDFNAKIVEEICEGKHADQRQSVTA
ncbi:type 1 glutamine amidotransferase domain-containing protein [Hyphomonas sp.]|uniref:type 1 glutamine amidotransferase domain-containing protein n=1 Tax=Hyphomonas sp. TaxID=87 RepID=UPI003D2A0220|tara:strand:+ start:23 stop:598 length:576 start_codon:yes stop_codon:yes gene_type:complete